MAVLVSGGAGYIGSHTALELMQQGREVIYFDNLQKGHKRAVLSDKFYIADLRDQEALEKVFQENEIEAVVQFAADSLVGESVTVPFKYYNNNVISTLRLLETMVKYDVKKIVFSSTAATYGQPKRVPILESDETLPTNPYGETKLAVERLLKWADNAYGIKYVALRYFNAAGADRSGRIGEDHSPESHLIPIILQAALGQRDHVEIYGDDYDTPDGSCIRDYIHVTDLANAHIRAIEKLERDNTSAVYNLGNGKGFSVKEVIDVARKVTGVNIKADIAPRRAGDPAVLVASSEKAKKELGWNPVYGDLETIIETAWQWHKNNPEGFEDSGI